MDIDSEIPVPTPPQRPAHVDVEQTGCADLVEVLDGGDGGIRLYVGDDLWPPRLPRIAMPVVEYR